jgi:hypothetical protein
LQPLPQFLPHRRDAPVAQSIFDDCSFKFDRVVESYSQMSLSEQGEPTAAASKNSERASVTQVRSVSTVDPLFLRSCHVCVNRSRFQTTMQAFYQPYAVRPDVSLLAANANMITLSRVGVSKRTRRCCRCVLLHFLSGSFPDISCQLTRLKLLESHGPEKSFPSFLAVSPERSTRRTPGSILRTSRHESDTVRSHQ